MAAPMIMDVKDIKIIGLDTVFVSVSIETGLCSRGPHSTTIDIRIEQKDVNLTERRIKNIINELQLYAMDDSIIMSFEQNPAVKGIPHKALLAISKHEAVTGID